MQADLLHLIETAKGITTADLWGEIKTSRSMGLWPHGEPRNTTELQRLLRVLQGLGHVAMTPGGWMLTSQVRHARPGPKPLPALFD